MLPRRIENKTLLTNEERQHLNQLFAGEKYLRDTIIESSAKEPFLFMRSYCLPRINSICLMHAILIPQQNIKLSPYLARLLEWLDVSLQDRGILSLTSDPEAYVGTYRGLIYQLNNLSQQAKKRTTEFAGTVATIQTGFIAFA